MPQFRKRPPKRAQELRNNPTAAERKLWMHLGGRRLDGHKFTRQATVGPFICDFMCRERGLVIEVDGGQHAERTEYDSERTRYLEQEGLRVVRFWNNDVIENIDGVLQAITTELGMLSPRFSLAHPQPPPASGRGLQ